MFSALAPRLFSSNARVIAFFGHVLDCYRLVLASTIIPIVQNLCPLFSHGFILQRPHFMETATGSDMMVMLRLFSSRDSCITIQGKQQAQTTMSPVVPPSIPNMLLICRRQRMGMNGIAAHSARFIQCPASRSEQPQEVTAVFRLFCAPPIPHDAFPPEKSLAYIRMETRVLCHSAYIARARTDHTITGLVSLEQNTRLPLRSMAFRAGRHMLNTPHIRVLHSRSSESIRPEISHRASPKT